MHRLITTITVAIRREIAAARAILAPPPVRHVCIIGQEARP